MPHICVITGAHLCRNPRVVKEATALAAEGYEVTVLHQVHDSELAEQDEELAGAGGFARRAAVDTRVASSGMRSSRLRIQRRLAVEAVRHLDWQLPDALGYGARASLDAARVSKADLVIGHQEIGLWVVSRLLEEGRRVGFDMEDWHSRDQLLEGRSRPFRLIERIEREVLRNASHVTTTSQSMSDALSLAYDAPAPTVVYNAFPWRERDAIDGQLKDRRDRHRPSLHWVSQAIGSGRGLEQLGAALHAVDIPVEIHLRGHCHEAALRWLKSVFPEEGVHRLYVHETVPPEALLSRIAEHDVGLALELPDSPNHDLTVSNKLFHYLLAGLAVISTDTKGQSEIAQAAPGVVTRCRAGDVEDFARVLNELVSDPTRLHCAKAAALGAARTIFCWEKNAPRLLESVEAALAGRRIGREWVT